jgi:hypothetical protein
MPVDRNGNPVIVGTKVRVLKIEESLRRKLPADEVAQLDSMVGEVFEVFEIDEYGHPWVEKTWDAGDGHPFSHTILLEPDEMEVV